MAKVFLSSTSKDLREYRAEVANAINSLHGFECIQMETWGAVNATPTNYDATKVADSDLFVLLVGAIYGDCPPSSETSFTELEYEKAVELNKPRIVFVASGKFRPDLELMDSLPPNDQVKRKTFKERVRQERIWAEFTDPHQLANQVTKGILKWQDESRQACLDGFLRHTIENNSEISLRGVMQTERQVAVKLDEVYVSLKTERETRRRMFVDSREISLIDGSQKIISSGYVDLDEPTPIPGSRVRFAERTETHVEKIDLAEAVREHRHIVILGDPGAGKTTLMRFLALHFARAWRDSRVSSPRVSKGLSSPDEPSLTVGLLTPELTVTDKDGNDYGNTRLPIFMRVADFAEELRKNRNSKLRDCLLVPFRNIERNSDGELTRLLEEKLRRGEALLLLDGLDEVTEPSDRVVIVQQIEEFVRSTHSDNRVIVTSRIVGYRQAPLGSDYQHFTLLDLEREQIEKFLNGWCFAVERFLSPTTSEEEITRRAQAEIDGILKSVDSNTGVERLATNPLLLTILALIHRNGSRLPSRRVELYELAANSLLSDWLAAKGMDSAKHISRADAAQFLWPLAYWMHSERPSGLAYEQEVEEKLRQFRSRDTGKPPYHPEVIAAVDDFLARASQSTGIFVLRAPKQFGFLHLTFQEYFAALELTRNSLQMAVRIHEARQRPRWEEPILLAIASRQSPDDADMLVRSAILAEGELAQQQGFKPSDYEDILHRDLFLAARCLADNVPVYPELRQQIVNRLCELYFDPKSPESLKDDIRQSFALLGGSTAADDLIKILLGRLSHSDEDARSEAARALGAMGEKVASDQVMTALVRLLPDSKWPVVGVVVDALGAMGEKAASDEVITALFKQLDDPNERTWHSVGRALRAMGKKANRGEVIAALLKRLANPDGPVRSAAACVLGRIGDPAATEAVIQQMFVMFADSDWNVRHTAAWALGRLSGNNDSEKVIERLLGLARSNKWQLRDTAVMAIRWMEERAASEKVIECLLGLLADRSNKVRETAAWALGWLGKGVASEKIIERLNELSLDNDAKIRWGAAVSLGRLGKYADRVKVIDRLLVLTEDGIRNVRFVAVEMLGELGEQAATEVVIKRLLELLTDRGGEEHAVARALGEMGEKAAREEVISVLFGLFEDSDEYVRSEAASALGKLVPHVKEADNATIIKLALPLARNKRRGKKNDSKRQAGYVMLRNLLTEKRSDSET